MKKTKPQAKPGFIERLANWGAKAAGSSAAFLGAFALILLWGITGPLFHYSETWQLVINTGTTIITFLMVFLIQKSQNKDSLAIQLKLNELVASHEMASNRLVDVENITEDELKVIQKYYAKLSNLTKESVSIKESHSLDEAEDNHESKQQKKGKNVKPGSK
ncbi:MAG: low affinity iron permease family protein [Ferruginibacter sp.]